MGGFIGQALDPLGVFSGLADPGGPTGPDTTPSIWNGPKGFMGGMLGDIARTAQAHNDAKNPPLQLDMSNNEPPPRVAPFQAQWSYTPGKGPQWLEPVDNGFTSTPTRQGDITFNKETDNGWSSRINTGPAKGNRF